MTEHLDRPDKDLLFHDQSIKNEAYATLGTKLDQGKNEIFYKVTNFIFEQETFKISLEFQFVDTFFHNFLLYFFVQK